MRFLITILISVSLAAITGLYFPSGTQVSAAADLAEVRGADLQRVEQIGRSLENARWEEALLGMLEIPANLRKYVARIDPSQTDVAVIDQVRDRAWRHLRDRLACADRPRGSVQMRSLYPRLQRIPIVCIASGVATPVRSESVMKRWARRIELRIESDAVIDRAEESLGRGAPVEAIQLLEPWLQRIPADPLLEDYIHHLHDQVVDRLRAQLQRGRQLDDPVAVLTAERQLLAIVSEDPDGVLQGNWARKQLLDGAEGLLHSGQPCGALLMVASLLESGVEVGHRLDRLRTRIEVPLRPIICRGRIPAGAEKGSSYLIRAGVPTLRTRKATGTPNSVRRWGESGRRWSRSPAHVADVRRWNQLIDEIVELTQRWIAAPPVEAALIRSRRTFRLEEASRLARRIADSPARRWRTTWEESVPIRVGEDWRLVGRLPFQIFDLAGRQTEEVIEVEVVLSPADPQREGLPVIRADLDRARQRVLATLDHQLETRADEIGRLRLRSRLRQARGLAAQGDLAAARELLLPALIGASEGDQDLLDEGAAEIARWCQIGVDTVWAATRRSSTP
ncbi:MAG: hypothetical protein OSB09_07240 [Planctomycetota bacterium]|nr:hypothetical protein [Planctomycetota bacterium]